ncbi:hypothetical protein Tco_0468264 [Tanacetum coccineum]
MSLKRTTTPMNNAAIKGLIAQGVADALVEYEANRSSKNGDDSHDSGSLTQWFEKMESVFHISNCTIACQIKFATCTLLGSALMWWNSHVKTVGHDTAYGMPWKKLRKMLTDKMFPKESNQVDKYVGGLLDMIQGSLMASKLKTMQEAIEIANDLMDQKVRTLLKDKLRTKENLITTQATTTHNNRLSKGKTWLELILLGLLRRRSMLELYHCATSASFTKMAHAL